MIKFIRYCLLIPIAGIGLVRAQQAAMWEQTAVFREAEELFMKEKYGAAQEKFGVFLRRMPASRLGESDNGMRPDAEYYFAACSFHLLRNDASSLLTAFVTAHPSHPKANDALYGIAKLHYIKREYKDAVPFLEALEWNALPKAQADDARFMMGWCYLSAGEKDKAAGVFRNIMNIPGSDKHDAATYYYSLIQYEKGNFQEAANGFESLKESKVKGSEDIPVLLANCYLKLRNYPALQDLSARIQENPAGVSPEFFLVTANALYEKGDYKGSSQNFQTFVQKHGTLDRDAEYRLGYSLYRLGNYKESRPHFEKVLRPEDALAQNASYHLGLCFLEEENYENARLAFRKARLIKGEKSIAEDALYQFAKISFATRYFDDALVAFQDLLNEYPSTQHASETKALMGEILLYSEKFKEAIEYFEQSKTRNERSQKAYQQACFSYASDMFHKNLYDKAAEYFKKAFNLRYDANITLLSYYWYAECLYRNNDLDNAIGYFMTFTEQSGAAKSPFYSKANYSIGWGYFRQKKYESAVKYFEKFIALANRKEDAEIYVDAFLRAGDCEFIRKRYEQALSYYSQVRDFNDRAVDYAWYQVGQCQQRTENYQGAVASYTQVIERYRKSDFRDKALLRIADVYGSFLQDWKNCGRYAELFIEDYPRDPMVPVAYNLAATAAANSGNNASAINFFKTVLMEYGDQKEFAIKALDNLSELLPGKEYDKLMQQYKEKYPEGGGEELCEISYRTAYDRFMQDEFAGAIDQFSAYMRDCRTGKHYEDAAYYRGVSYEKSQDAAKALEDYRIVWSATPIHPKAVECLNRSAEMLYKQGNYMSTLQLYTTLDEVADKMEDKIKARFGKARSYVAMKDWIQAQDVYMSVYSDPNATQYSRDRAHVQIANCKYNLGQKQEANQIYSTIEKNYKNEFGAESQYMITRILYDDKKLEESRTAGLYLKDNYPTQHYWKAKTFLVLVEVFLEMGDTMGATGNLERLAKETRFPDVMEEAKKRLDEIRAIMPPPPPAGGQSPGAPEPVKEEEKQ